MVGTFHLDPAISVAASRARWPRIRRVWDDDSDGRSQPVRNVSRICELWMGRRRHRTTESILALRGGRGLADPSVRGSSIAIRAASCWHPGRILWYRTVLRIGHHG